VIGWLISTAFESSALLAIQYIESVEQFESGGKAIQFVLTPPQ